MIDACKQLKPEEPRHCCHVSKKSLKFLKGGKPPGGDSEESQPCCTHFESEEDNQIGYLNEYSRYLRFTKLLKEKLRSDIPRDVLIKSLSRDLNALTDLSAREKELFSSEERVEKLLQNPLLEIVTSIKELDGYNSKNKQHE